MVFFRPKREKADGKPFAVGMGMQLQRVIAFASGLALSLVLTATGTNASVLEGEVMASDSTADSWDDGWDDERIVTKHFLVVGTFKTFRSAERAAFRLAGPSGLRLEPERLDLHEGQPTYSRETCELNGWDYPCYVPRGRFDDGAYLSVEPSDGYGGMKPGYFVVVAASGSLEDVLAQRQLLARRGIFGYVQSSEVWLGCIH